MNDNVVINLKELGRAFEMWETYVRKDLLDRTNKFLTTEECLAMGISQISKERAEYMMELLQNV